jgi:Holliday junction resolvasome RuvABC endonuclease subunit
MKYIGVDLGTVCGISVVESINGNINIVECDRVNLKNKQKDPDVMRYVNFKNVIRQYFEKYKNIDCVYYEHVKSHKGIFAAHVYGGFQAILMMECFAQKIQCCGIAVGSIKKFATGNGRASKENMLDFAKLKCKTSNVNVIDHNAADSLAVVLCGLKIRGL